MSQNVVIDWVGLSLSYGDATVSAGIRVDQWTNSIDDNSLQLAHALKLSIRRPKSTNVD